MASVFFQDLAVFKVRMVIDPSTDPNRWPTGRNVTHRGWSCEAGQVMAIVFTAPPGDTKISLPCHHVGVLAVSPWLDTGATPSPVRYAEKQIVGEAQTPVQSLFVLTTPSLPVTGMMHDAASMAIGGGFVVELGS